MILPDSEVASLKSALRGWEWFGYISTAIVGIGCIGEFIAEFTSLPTCERCRHKLAKASLIILILGIAGELLSAARTSQLSDQIIANIEERAADAEKQAEEAKKEAEAEHLARVQLEQQMAWRYLSKEQGDAFCSALPKDPKDLRAVSITSSSQDAEAFRYAQDFDEALRRCVVSAGLTTSDARRTRQFVLGPERSAWYMGEIPKPLYP